MSSSFVPPPPATAEVGEEKGSERNRRTLLAWPSPKLASGSLGLRDVCSWLPLRSVLSQVLWRHLWLNATVTWGIHPASPAVTNLVFPAFLVVHCIHGLHGSRYGIKLILSTVGPTSAQSFAWASTRIIGPSHCSCFFTFSIVSCSPDFSGRHQESRIQPTVPSSPHAERRGEIHPNPSSGGMACGTPGIKNPPHETHSF